MIPPTLRERHRYILFHFDSERELSEGQVKDGIYSGILTLLGELGSSLANPKIVSYNSKTRQGILRCSHEELEKVKASLVLVSGIAGVHCVVRLKRVSGTIRKLGAGKAI